MIRKIISSIFRSKFDFLRSNRTYDEHWDFYAKKIFPKIKSSMPFSKREIEEWRVLNTTDNEYVWPGDEWGDLEDVNDMLNDTLKKATEANPKVLCELGSGSGRYTVQVLEEFENATILSFDVSTEFESILRQRCKKFIENGRLQTFHLDNEPTTLLSTINDLELLGKVDAIYSFDAMVHVDLHTLYIYWLSATKILKPGGTVSMNVANACNPKAIQKLDHDSRGVYRKKGNAGAHFMWISKDIIITVLSHLGFEVSINNGNGRDLSFNAKLVNPISSKTIDKMMETLH